MGRKSVVFLLRVGLLLILLLAAPRASAGSGTEYLSYTVEENLPKPAASSAPGSVQTIHVPAPTQSSPPAASPAPPSNPGGSVGSGGGSSGGSLPDFSIGISPKSRTITRGESTTYTVTVKSVDGFSGYVSLGVSGLPSGAGYSLVPRVGVPANGSAVAVLTVTTTSSAAVGDYTITVTGTGNGTKSASAGLTVTAPAPPTPPITFTYTPPPQLTYTPPRQFEFYPHDKQGYAAVPGVRADGTVVTGYASVYSNIGKPDVGGATIAAARQDAVSRGAVIVKPVAPTISPVWSPQPNPAPTPAPAPAPSAPKISAPKISAPPVNSPPPTAKSSPPPVSPKITALVNTIMNWLKNLRFR